MKKLIFLVPFLFASVAVAEETHYGLDLYAFGLSRHTNRDYDWREVNPGLAVAPYVKLADHLDAFVLAGGYRNSIDKNTVLTMVGIRLMDTYKDVTYGVSGAAGLMTGYPGPPSGNALSAFVGYKRVNLEFAYMPRNAGDDTVPGTAVFCAWLRFRVWDH
jgi:hypothetical protein